MYHLREPESLSLRKVLDLYRWQVTLYYLGLAFQAESLKRNKKFRPQTYFGTAFSSAEGFSRGESILTEGFSCRPNNSARLGSTGRLLRVPNTGTFS